MKFSLLVWSLFALFSASLYAQKGPISYHFKQGEVLDILLINQSPNSEELFEKYKKTAFPVAFEYTYQPVPGFGVSKLTLGNHLPNSFIFGKWASPDKREGFLQNISKKVPDFHQQRRALFNYFGLTYYEMHQETSFSIDPSKHNVVTAFWSKDPLSFNKFFKKWEKHMTRAGAKIIIQFKEGKSPLGYYYNPDLLLIAQWEDEASFHTFTKQYPLSAYQSLKNVHQFVLQ